MELKFRESRKIKIMNDGGKNEPSKFVPSKDFFQDRSCVFHTSFKVQK